MSPSRMKSKSLENDKNEKISQAQKTRSRIACLSCRQSRTKCDGKRQFCGRCLSMGKKECIYKSIGSAERRANRTQKKKSREKKDRIEKPAISVRARAIKASSLSSSSLPSSSSSPSPSPSSSTSDDTRIMNDNYLMGHPFFDARSDSFQSCSSMNTDLPIHHTFKGYYDMMRQPQAFYNSSTMGNCFQGHLDPFSEGSLLRLDQLDHFAIPQNLIPFENFNFSSNLLKSNEPDRSSYQDYFDIAGTIGNLNSQ